jgi:MFS transporter, ACS family, hexuronate transporter
MPPAQNNFWQPAPGASNRLPNPRAREFTEKCDLNEAARPFVAADLGNFTGGFLSGYCIRRGIPVIRARMWVCAVSCLPILAGIPAARVHSAYSALALICVALWGYASWSTMGLTLPSDLFPQDVVATVTGLSGFAAGLAGAAFTFAVGFLVDRFSCGPAFLVAGLRLFLLIAAPNHDNSEGLRSVARRSSRCASSEKVRSE